MDVGDIWWMVAKNVLILLQFFQMLTNAILILKIQIFGCKSPHVAGLFFMLSDLFTKDFPQENIEI